MLWYQYQIPLSASISVRDIQTLYTLITAAIHPCAGAQGVLAARLKVMSVTFDNGIENRGHEDLGVRTFFADAYASWQRGANENGNKMLRRYFPKGTDFGKVRQSKIDWAVDRINNKPRKILGYESALEVARRSGIIKNIKSESVLTLG